MIIDDLIEEFIEYPGLHPLMSLSMDSKSMIEYEIDTLPFDRLSKYDWRIGEEVEFLREIVHISIEDCISIDSWFCEDLIPFIDDEYDTLFCLDRFSDDMLILVSDSLECVHDDRYDISSLYRSLSTKDTPLFDIGRSYLPSATYTRSIDKTYLSIIMSDDSIYGVTGSSRHIFHDRSHLSGDRIHETRFSDIRATDDSELEYIRIDWLFICLRLESERPE
jgi:hypothetical protein